MSIKPREQAPGACFGLLIVGTSKDADGGGIKDRSPRLTHGHIWLLFQFGDEAFAALDGHLDWKSQIINSSKEFLMFGRNVLIGSTVLLGLAAPQASAATLTASSHNALFSDFTIEFTDSNHNNLLDFSEITSFSGYFRPNRNLFYEVVVEVPEMAGLSVGKGTSAFLNVWVFDSPGDLDTGEFGANYGFWSYKLDLDPSPVPLPAALPLLVMGFGALGAIGGYRKRRVATARRD